MITGTGLVQIGFIKRTLWAEVVFSTNPPCAKPKTRRCELKDKISSKASRLKTGPPDET